MGVVYDVKQYVTAEWSNGDDSTEPTPSESARLYHCDACDATYVSGEEMWSCSQCDRRLEHVPSERDLGHV